jgi:hypothetical protein
VGNLLVIIYAANAVTFMTKQTYGQKENGIQEMVGSLLTSLQAH